VFKLALGLWLAMLLNRHFRGKALIAPSSCCLQSSPPVLSTSPGSGCRPIQRHHWTLFHLGHHHHAASTELGRSRHSPMTSIIGGHIWRGVPFFATRCCWPADHQPRSTRPLPSTAPGRGNRFWYVTWPAAAARHHGGDRCSPVMFRPSPTSSWSYVVP